MTLLSGLFDRVVPPIRTAGWQTFYGSHPCGDGS